MLCGPLGKRAPGAYTDVIVVNYDPRTPFDAANPDIHVLFRVSGRTTDTTIIDGRVVMANGEPVDIDEREIVSGARQLAEKVWQRFRGYQR